MAPLNSVAYFLNSLAYFYYQRHIMRINGAANLSRLNLI
jgi:hypothetical protein